MVARRMGRNGGFGICFSYRSHAAGICGGSGGCCRRIGALYAVPGYLRRACWKSAVSCRQRELLPCEDMERCVPNDREVLCRRYRYRRGVVQQRLYARGISGGMERLACSQPVARSTYRTWHPGASAPSFGPDASYAEVCRVYKAFGG